MQIGSENVAYKFTLDLTNCTSNVDSTTEYNSGDVVDIVLTANEHALFSTSTYQKPELSYFDEDMWETVTKRFTVSADRKTATYTLTISNNTTIEANAEIDGVVFDLSDVQFASTNIKTSDIFAVGDVVSISVIANEGYYFGQVPHLTYLDLGGTYHTIPLETTQTDEHKTTFELDFIIPETQTNVIEMYAIADIIPKTDKYGIITIYNPTPNELKEIGNVRYMVLAGESTGVVDLGAFISSLIKVYVNIPDYDKANVKLGGYNTGVQSAVILDDIVETNCGTIEIVGKYGNLMDYKNTTVEIYLPFIGFEKLDTDKVMNEVISLTYKTNIINGDSIACIYNTTGTLLYTFNCNVAFEIPYKTSGTYDDRSDLKIDSNYLFGFTPFVTIRTNKSYNTATLTANDNRVAVINELNGFIACSEVFNTIKATTQEKEEIDRILKDGIILDDVVES